MSLCSESVLPLVGAFGLLPLVDPAQHASSPAAAASLGLVHLSARLLAHRRLSPRGRWLVGLVWSALLPVEDRVVQHELAKATPLLVHLATSFAAKEEEEETEKAAAATAKGSSPTTVLPRGVSAESPADAAALLLAEYASSDEANAAHAKRAGAVSVLQALLRRAASAAASSARNRRGSGQSSPADSGGSGGSGSGSGNGSGSGSGSEGEGGSNNASGAVSVPSADDPCFPVWAAAAAGLRAMGVEPL